MTGVIMAVLGLLAAEDLKYKAVTVWKLVLFGLGVYHTGSPDRHFKTVDRSRYISRCVVWCYGTAYLCMDKPAGSSGRYYYMFLGLVGGIVRILGIFLAALLLMGLCGLILLMTGRVDKKTSMPVIPFVFLAVVWRGL